jgi:ubiquinone/menaquinone biosynthesis C-methylase UbiE
MTESERDGAPIDEYARLARRYDSRWSSYVEATIRGTMAHLEPRPGERALDVGCGTGALLAALSLACPGVILAGIDPSREMLRFARGRLAPEVDLREARAERIPHDDSSFHQVVSCSVFHHIGEPARALSEMRRVLKPGGKLVITDWSGDDLLCRACGHYLRLTGRHVVRVYREREIAGMLRDAGFSEVRVDRFRAGWFWKLMASTARR